MSDMKNSGSGVMSELPDYVDSSLLKKGENDYPDHSFVRPFADAETPILSVPTVADLAGTSRETARQRLNLLESRGVVRSQEINDKGTQVYWLSHPQSKHPVPNDIPLEDPSRLNELERLREQTEQLETEVEELHAFKTAIQKINHTVTGTIFFLALLLIPVILVDNIGGVPAFFRALFQEDIAFGLMLIVASLGLWLVSRTVSQAIGEPTLVDHVKEQVNDQ
jgi:hypothetical protein